MGVDDVRSGHTYKVMDDEDEHLVKMQASMFEHLVRYAHRKKLTREGFLTLASMLDLGRFLPDA